MNFAVIMAGGRGERLWPLSTPNRPKQFLKLLGEATMLQATVGRIAPLIPIENTFIVAGKEHRGQVSQQLPRLPGGNLIIEPMGRGTAPCVGLAALRLSRRDPDSVMVLLPADHLIGDNKRYLQALKRAITVAMKEECLVCLGITPDRPATGYGYIKAAGLSHNSVAEFSALRVEHFTEKPDQKTARRFLRERGYFWNSGMFVWRTAAILREIEAHMPDLYEGLMRIEDHLGAADEEAVIEQIYHRQPSNSIDYGVMEKSKRVWVVPTGEIGWSDVGDWVALERILERDEDGNVVLARHLGSESENSTIVSEKGRLIATLGIENLVIVDAEQGLLVMDKSRAQELKDLVRKLEAGD